VDSAPCTAPCTFQWTAGTNHTIATTTPQSGGTGTQYVSASWSDGGALSHSITASASPATYTASFTTQYYLTTAASPPAGGTISPASGWYNSGAVATVAATANTGYVFSGFTGALTGTTTPQNLTMNAPKNVTASFVPAPLVLPTPLKGFVYFPRGHAWYSMLYDWYTQDCTTSTIPEGCAAGLTVGQVVSNDLQRLASSGFNLIHLYLWDQDMIQWTLNPAAPLVGPGFEAPGFVGLDNGGPESSPADPRGPNDLQHNQWTALAEFISQAKNRGLWVFADFAAYRPQKKITLGGDSASVGTEYGNWVNRFVDYLAGYQNVLIWGITYGTGQPIGGPFWHSAYPMVASRLQQYNYTSPAGRALLAVNSPFGIEYTDVLPILSGYRWTWEDTQRDAYNWQQLANDVGFFAPDVYGFQLWNANAGDLQANLKCVAGIANAVVCPTPTCGANCAPIPFVKMVVTEFGTGSSLESPPIGNGTASYGDAQTPTTTADGQGEWLTQTLCLMSRLNITKYAYFGLYDSASFWEQKYNYTVLDLAWLGYWGLSSEGSGYGDKPAWSAMAGFNPNNCPAPNVPPTPVIALQADAFYYTLNDTGKITYTAANVTSLSLSEPKFPPDRPASYSCDPGNTYAPLHPDLRVGSCAFTNIKAAYTGTITLTGENTNVEGIPGAGVSTRVATSVTVGLAPIVYGVVNYTTGQVCNLTANPGCVITASQMDILEIYGVGFNPTGGNTVKLVSQSTEAWLYETDGYYFWDQSRTQLNAQIACYVTPGSWVLYVFNPNNSGAPSNGVPVSISAGASCP
jgi:hypothetical protein